MNLKKLLLEEGDYPLLKKISDTPLEYFTSNVKGLDIRDAANFRTDFYDHIRDIRGQGTTYNTVDDALKNYLYKSYNASSIRNKRNSIREVYENKEADRLIEEGLLTGLQTAASVLGFTAMGSVAAFGAAVIVASAKRAKSGSKLRNFFRKLSGKKDIDFEKGTNKLKSKHNVKNYSSYRSSETAEKLEDVLKAIKERDWEEATYRFKVSGLEEDKEAIRVLALAVTEEFGEPPLYYISPGNESYQFLKRIIGPRTAKAVADSVLYALDRNKSYFTDLEIMDTEQ